MFKVEFNRQLGMLGGKLQISEKYSSKNVANNIQAHLIGKSLGEPNEVQRLEMTVFDNPIRRFFYKLFKKDVNNMPVKISGKIKGQASNLQPMKTKEFTEKIKFKDLKDLATTTPFPPKDSFVDKINGEMNTIVFRDILKGLK